MPSPLTLDYLVCWFQKARHVKKSVVDSVAVSNQYSKEREEKRCNCEQEMLYRQIQTENDFRFLA